jgi:hypothetical protein
MSADDLKTMERDAFRKFYDDGLFDIYLGVLLFMMGTIGALDELLGITWIAVIYVGFALGFSVLRARFVKRRLGTFKPAAARKRKLRATTAVLAGSVVLGAVAFGITAAVPGESGFEWVRLIPLVWFVNATLVFGATAYFLDVPRFYAYGPLFGISVMLEIYPRVLFDIEFPSVIAFGLPAAVMVVIGLRKLPRFLRDFPPRHVEATHNGAQS